MRHRHTALVEKSSDLEAFRDSVNDAAGVSAGLWLTYLLVLSYLLVAAGEVTHRNLLLEDPVKLPFLNVDLPLVGFFLVGPAIFVLVHAYVLLHFTLLAGKIGAFHTELQKQVVDAVVRARIRRQLPINVFVQLLAGPREVRNGVVGIMLWVLAHVSLVLGPLALLIFFQLQFLPYHDAVVTWCQRIMVVVDLVLLWMLWPAIVRCETVELSWRNSRFGTKLSIGLVSLIPVLLTFGIVTFPGEWIEMTLPSIWLIRSKDRGENRLWPMTSVRDLLVDGTVDPRHGKLTSYWSNRLVLPDIDVIDHAKYDTEPKIAALSETIFLRARNLTDAVLTNAVLRKANFEAALLDRAVMDGADLRDAKFICASGSVEKVDCAQLGEASLTAAHLQGASFDYAQMQGVKLLSAELQGANLRFAHLEGAKMPGAQLEGADLSGAYLQKANLEGANLEGVSLLNADLQDAVLSGAHLEGAALLPGAGPPNEKVAEVMRGWATLDHPPTGLNGEKSRAEYWRNAGCGADGVPYVMEGLIRRLHEFDAQPEKKAQIATAFLDEECLGARGLSERSKVQLYAVPGRRSHDSVQEPKQTGAGQSKQ